MRHQAPEPGVVLREVIDVGRGHLLRWTTDRFGAVEVGRALDLERELDIGQEGIESARRLIAPGIGAEMQGVAGEIPECLCADDERAGQVVDPVDQGRVRSRRQVVRSRHPFHRNDREALAPVDQEVVRRERKAGAQQPDEQRSLPKLLHELEVIANLEELDSIRGPRQLDHVEAARLAAEELHAPLPGKAKAACCAVPSSSTV
jgi:hypothetical protein